MMLSRANNVRVHAAAATRPGGASRFALPVAQGDAGAAPARPVVVSRPGGGAGRLGPGMASPLLTSGGDSLLVNVERPGGRASRGAAFAAPSPADRAAFLGPVMALPDRPAGGGGSRSVSFDNGGDGRSGSFGGDGGSGGSGGSGGGGSGGSGDGSSSSNDSPGAGYVVLAVGAWAAVCAAAYAAHDVFVAPGKKAAAAQRQCCQKKGK